MNTLVIDSSALCYSAAYSTGSLQWGNVYTGVFHGFLTQLHTLSGQFHTNRFVFCWDSRSSLRKKAYPNYKNRDPEEMTESDKEVKEILYSQIPVLRRKIIPQLGFKNSFHQVGHEADDLIAAIVLNDLVEKPIIVSSDKDLYQLLHKAPMYSLARKAMYAKREFVAEYQIAPEEWSKVKAIAGCISDTVEGIGGVGDKTAAKYLRGELKKGVKFNAIIGGDAIIQRNAPLVTLPLPTTEIPIIESDRLDYDNFIDVCREYGLRKVRGMPGWSSIFARN